ncbi:MAG: peptidoglycan-associated lipoprotein Pal [Moraxellaceae bacterium]|nr:peptidoglycan-associated lipoprotein Pal [Moraxellaceae bacterium]
MFMTKQKVLPVALLGLSLGLGACTTTKTPDTSASTAQADEAARAAAAKAAADAAAAAQTSAANAGSDLSSQSLNDASKAGANLANDVAARLGLRVFYFGYDDASVQGADLQALKAHAAYLAKNSAARLQVSGHADERGTREYNMALGERRAKAVASFLTANGAKSSQLEVVSYGEEKPAVAGESEEAWAKNRRVELDYTAGKP